MGNFLQITPFIHVPDLEAAISFFEDLLGFSTLLKGGGYAYVEREGVGVRLLQNHGEDGAPPGNRRYAYYIDVRDVDALHGELKPKLDRLPSDAVHGPADKPYGQRELLILAPDGNLLAFGQAISS
ncbi:MAG TPA: VOC family protein [Allosphingosinicella sp.]|jgi:catechol 2,3-dioxygenase-like lactoylglutathione lyase family enzyme|nr:VOC family protein [Allosphingosinicella sp.]